jgi:hypothetical protein
MPKHTKLYWYKGEQKTLPEICGHRKLITDQVRRNFNEAVRNGKADPLNPTIEDWMFPTKQDFKRMGLTYNGRPTTVTEIAAIIGRSDYYVRQRVEYYGLALTSENLKGPLPSSKRAKSTLPEEAADYNVTRFRLNTDSEQARLAAIPSPTKYELELWGDTRR